MSTWSRFANPYRRHSTLDQIYFDNIINPHSENKVKTDFFLLDKDYDYLSDIISQDSLDDSIRDLDEYNESLPLYHQNTIKGSDIDSLFGSIAGSIPVRGRSHRNSFSTEITGKPPLSVSSSRSGSRGSLKSKISQKKSNPNSLLEALETIKKPSISVSSLRSRINQVDPQISAPLIYENSILPAKREWDQKPILLNIFNKMNEKVDAQEVDQPAFDNELLTTPSQKLTQKLISRLVTKQEGLTKERAALNQFIQDNDLGKAFSTALNNPTYKMTNNFVASKANQDYLKLQEEWKKKNAMIATINNKLKKNKAKIDSFGISQRNPLTDEQFLLQYLNQRKNKLETKQNNLLNERSADLHEYNENNKFISDNGTRLINLLTQSLKSPIYKKKKLLEGVDIDKQYIELEEKMKDLNLRNRNLTKKLKDKIISDKIERYKEEIKEILKALNYSSPQLI